MREAYVKIGTEIINGVPTKFIEFNEFWETIKNDERYIMVYLNDNNQIID